MSDTPTLLLFRHDLRLADNPALVAVAASGQPVVALYILEEGNGTRPLGGAQRWWLHHSLTALAADLHQRYGLRPILKRGDPLIIVTEIIQQLDARAVHWNRRYAPAHIAADTALKEHLTARGINVVSHNSHLLHEPWTVQNQSGGPFRVFTPFWKNLQTLAVPTPLPVPTQLNVADVNQIKSDDLTNWQLLPQPPIPNWAAAFSQHWQVGEAGAAARADAFLASGLLGYAELRDRPDLPHTSALSPHLALGEIGPRQLWHSVKVWAEHQDNSPARKDADKFLSELAWREFAYHLLYHFPTLPTQNYREDFNAFPWADDAAALARWQHGQTGYPIVDAGMRQLWQTGWLHNRVRMIVASFLIKHLLIHWRHGEDWFWDTLVDADAANNAASWQWVAGSGADAAPYFRIFNPISQGQKFDPTGAYVRRWCPELVALPNDLIHQPWAAPALVLKAANVTLGENYPHPMVDHFAARDRALAAFASIKKAA